MSLETNDSFLELTIKELSKDDPFYDVLEKVVSHLQISFLNGGSESGISIVREGFNDSFVGTYSIREDGSGKTIGLFKNIEGQAIPISLPLPGEIRLVRGSGIGELIPPRGWLLVTDETIIRKYNIGTSPNWNVAAIEYIGV